MTKRTLALRVGVLSLASVLCSASCGGNDAGSDTAQQARITAHVLPLQRVNLEGFAPAEASAGHVRFEASNFAYEVPLTTTEPKTVTAPVYFGADGLPSSGRVRVFWVPGESMNEPSAGANGASSRPIGAIDLHLDLEISALPEFAYNGPPGLLLRSFLQGSYDSLEASYAALFRYGGTDSAKSAYATQQTNASTGLREAIAAIDRVRSTGQSEALGPVALGDASMNLELSLKSLRAADRAVAGFLVAERLATWTSDKAPGSVGATKQALGIDYESDASSWFPTMTDELSDVVLERAGRLASFVSHATAAVAIAGGLGLISGTVATAGAVVGAFAYCALTFAPAASATVIRAAGNLLRGGGSLQNYQYDTFAPGAKYVLSQTLSQGLGMLEDEFGPWVNTQSHVGDALGRLVSSTVAWTDSVGHAASDWLVDCVADTSQCLGSGDASGTDAGAGGMDGTDGENQVGHCDQANGAGSDAPVSYTFDVGTNCGDVTLQYETYSVEDAITVSYEGQMVASTGCVGANGTLPVHFCGSSSEVVVAVDPNCNGGTGTSWNFTLMCQSQAGM